MEPAVVQITQRIKRIVVNMVVECCRSPIFQYPLKLGDIRKYCSKLEDFKGLDTTQWYPFDPAELLQPKGHSGRGRAPHAILAPDDAHSGEDAGDGLVSFP